MEPEEVNVANMGAVLGPESHWESIGKSKEYFLIRGCFIDARGPLIIDEDTTWGFGAKVLTRTHDISEGEVGDSIDRPVVVKRGAWIGSFSLLYNCTVGEGAVVAAGAVVKSCAVANSVMVAGNPAMVIARWDGLHWKRVGKTRRILR